MTFKDQLGTDLGVFFNTNEFAETVAYKGVNVSAIVDRLKDQQIVSGNAAAYAQLQVKKTDVASPAYLDAVVFDAQSWVVERVESSDQQVWIITVRSNEGYVFK